jgi:hypothetical protein
MGECEYFYDGARRYIGPGEPPTYPAWSNFFFPMCSGTSAIARATQTIENNNFNWLRSSLNTPPGAIQRIAARLRMPPACVSCAGLY